MEITGSALPMEITSSAVPASLAVPEITSSAPPASLAVPEITSSALPEGNSVSQYVDLDALIDKISYLVERSEEKKTSRFPDFPQFRGCMPTYLMTTLIGSMDTKFENKEEALHLLKELSYLARMVKRCQEKSQLKEKMQHEIKNASEFIEKGFITCRAQIESSRFRRLFMTAHDEKKLSDIRQELSEMCRYFDIEIRVDILDAIEYEMRRGLPRGLPKMHAVGWEVSVKEVIDVLELESENRALAVVLHGVRGMGKTTLADAVFSMASFQGCKYSKIQLFDNRESIPYITGLQRLILKDLTESRNIAEIREPEDGQQELADILKKVPAFIYIDNVVREDELRQLLPEDLNSAKKVRLLITARNGIVGRAIPLNTRPIMYPMKGMSREWAVTLFNQKLFVDMRGKLNPDQLNHILNICDGNPLMLIKVAKALCFDEDKRNIFVLKSINRRFVVEGGKNKEKIEGS